MAYHLDSCSRVYPGVLFSNARTSDGCESGSAGLNGRIVEKPKPGKPEPKKQGEQTPVIISLENLLDEEFSRGFFAGVLLATVLYFAFLLVFGKR